MSYQGPPSDKDTPTQDRGLFNQEAQKHQCHHYVRMYGGQMGQYPNPRDLGSTHLLTRLRRSLCSYVRLRR